MSGRCLSPASKIRIAADFHSHSTSDDDSGCVLEEYSWFPSGIKPDMIHMYFACLPEEKVPYVNSTGEKGRLKQLQFQLPPQDSDKRYCCNLSKEEESEMLHFDNSRKEECLGRGIIKQLSYDSKRRHCHQCKGSLREGDLIICAERFDDGVQWHPQCFICTECANILVDLIYFKHGADVFCGRHHAEKFKPRCAKCDELIFSEECTEAEERTWHMSHFSCADCNIQLGGQRYITKNERFLCIFCYQHNYLIICNTCGEKIIPGQPHIAQGNIHWHTDERCFCCSKCSRNLLGKRYSFEKSVLYCENEKCDQRRASKQVSFKSRDAAVSQKFAPQPPRRHFPTPPKENVYETVLPCCSTDDSDDFDRSKRRRSRSADIRRQRVDDRRHCCEKSSRGSRRQNHYSKMPPPSLLNKRYHQRCSSCSSSESDSDDTFLSKYLAVTLTNYDNVKERKRVQKCQQKAIVSRVATSKNKSNHCTVS